MVTLVMCKNKIPHCLSKGMWFFFISLTLISIAFYSCKKDEHTANASLILKTGTAYTQNGAYISVGAPIKIGVLASGAGVPLTYIRIDKITGHDTLTQVDRGIYIGSEGLDADFSFSKDTSSIEYWRVMVMNADRDTAVQEMTFYKGFGTAYGPINYFEDIKLSFQGNHSNGHFLDVHTGNVFDEKTVTGHESEVDILAYYYITSGLSSPTFTCPGYTAAVAYYPQVNIWPVKNATLYDYRSSDNNLVTVIQFDAAQNDSLLVTAYKPDKVSGNCKFGYSGKVVPFKTQEGKYGLIKVIHADEKEDGVIEIAVKIQK
jgi:hypothetical protein